MSILVRLREVPVLPGGGDCADSYNAAMEKLSEQELEAEGEERKDITVLGSIVNSDTRPGLIPLATYPNSRDVGPPDL